MLFAPLILLMVGTLPAASPASNTAAEYIVLTAEAGEPAPIARVTVAVGPTEQVDGRTFTWWQLDVFGVTERRDDERGDRNRRGGRPRADELLMTLQAQTDRLPFEAAAMPPLFHRYILHVPATRETLDYRDVHTGRALLPPWTDFAAQFTPVAARGSGEQAEFPETCTYLGHVLSLRSVASRAWTPLSGARELRLDPELLVGTARNFREAEDGRLPNAKERDYTYVPFTQADYAVMLEAGTNLFCVLSDQEPFVRGEPVFYYRRPEKRRGRSTEPLYRLPADLYRSNFLGTHMFLDEPAIIMAQDEQVNRRLRRVSDVTALLHQRIRAQADSARALERQLASDWPLRDLRIENRDFPVWEVHDYTAFYQLEAGLAGFVHEGRYRLGTFFDERIGQWTGQRRTHTAEELLRYHYAFMRGAARTFGRWWGTSIYGQVDPAIAPRAVTLAYDMGARYIWFWTSDHEFHLPWKEQMALTRTLRDHAKTHPRPSIRALQPDRDLAIVLPYGSFISLDDVDWIEELRKGDDSPGSQRHRRIMLRALREIDAALAQKLDFDVTIDNGTPVTGYRRIVRISDAAE